MAFDINETLANMLGTIKTSVGENWGDVKSAMNEFMQSRKERLELLADMRIQGQIDDDDLKSRLDDEKLLLDSELHDVAIISKEIAQNAANAAIDILQKTILAAIKL